MSSSPPRRTALVTGAGKGIGRATAIELAARGARVALASRSRGDLEALASEIKRRGGEALAVPCDVTDPDAVDALVTTVAAWSDGLDVLVNNAGGAHVRRELQDLSRGDFDRGIALNLTAVHHCMQATSPLLFARAGGASVVNVVSIAADRGLAEMSYYCAAKAGVVGLTRAVAREWGPRGVRVNCIAPGWVETSLSQGLREDDDFFRCTIAEIPLARWGRTEEVAAAIGFLASPESSYVTGSTLHVDGGLLA